MLRRFGLPRPTYPQRSGVGRTQHSQVTAPGDFHRVGIPPGGRPRFRLRRAGGFPYRVGQGLQVIAGRRGRPGIDREPDHLPAARGGQPFRVLRAQVVAVGLGVGGKRAQNGGGVCVDVRQRRDGRTAARSARTATYRAHDVGRYRTRDRAATTIPHLTPTCRCTPRSPLPRTRLLPLRATPGEVSPRLRTLCGVLPGSAWLPGRLGLATETVSTIARGRLRTVRKRRYEDHPGGIGIPSV